MLNSDQKDQKLDVFRQDIQCVWASYLLHTRARRVGRIMLPSLMALTAAERICTRVFVACCPKLSADSIITWSIGHAWRMSTELHGLMSSATTISAGSQSFRSLRRQCTRLSSAPGLSIQLKANWPRHGRSAKCRWPVAVER
jgi:hypothetical protein